MGRGEIRKLISVPRLEKLYRDGTSLSLNRGPFLRPPAIGGCKLVLYSVHGELSIQSLLPRTYSNPQFIIIMIIAVR